MSLLGKKLRRGDGFVSFMCPGCKDMHVIKTTGEGAWQFNSDGDRPTFSPSVLVRTGHHVPHFTGGDCWCVYNKDHPDDPDPYECTICHSYVTDGQIQFLTDSTHHLSGQTVPLPDIQEN